MVKFPFRVGKAFLKYSRHPITIPRAEYAELENEDLAKGDVTVVSEFGNRPATIISSTAGWGDYYQITMHCGYKGDPMTRFPFDESIQVEIARKDGRVIVTLQRMEPDV